VVITPNIPNLPFTEKNGVKYFNLVAEVVKSEILPGIHVNAWGYNGMSPGPTICVYPGDYVCLRVHNKLPQPTSVHWHGLDVPNGMDGVPEIEPSPKIDPGHYFDYHFKITNAPGTHMYHSHFYSVVQDMLGLEGGFIIFDPNESKKDIQKDYYLMLGAFKLKGLEPGVLKNGTYEIDPFAHESNFFTINGKCFPYTALLPVNEGDRVRIRFGNIGMMNHPIHFHGHQFYETAADGNSIAIENRLKKNTILISSGTTRDIEFIANNPGRWPLHCHFPHHVSNNMTLSLGGMTTAVVYE